MSQKSSLPQSRRHILVFDEDWEFLQLAYGQESKNHFGVGPVIRQIIHVKVLALRAKIAQAQDARNQVEAAKEPVS